jgi:hypothetical protein
VANIIDLNVNVNVNVNVKGIKRFPASPFRLPTSLKLQASLKLRPDTSTGQDGGQAGFWVLGSKVGGGRGSWLWKDSTGMKANKFASSRGWVSIYECSLKPLPGKRWIVVFYALIDSNEQGRGKKSHPQPS